jgi:hypothetical protein
MNEEKYMDIYIKELLYKTVDVVVVVVVVVAETYKRTKHNKWYEPKAKQMEHPAAQQPIRSVVKMEVEPHTLTRAG